MGEMEYVERGARWVAGIGRRSDAVFCSPQCKVRAWRRRAEPFGLLFPQLVRASDLSPKQVRDGLAVKDQAAQKGWPPLSWNRAAGYQLGAERAVLETYERAVVSEKLTEFRRFITGTVAPHAVSPAPTCRTRQPPKRSSSACA
ncbi:hypothetical protein ACFU9Y_39255 [Streptomyces sp. NPDC057621]|uniref:hypothetical protein n=1 Tax=Streptomyces sp. NPDC057621 TaxID=3346186 RepID=UPI0036BB2F6D